MGDEYTGTRVSMLNDREVDSLRKIVALLNGAATGDAPLVVSGTGGNAAFDIPAFDEMDFTYVASGAADNDRVHVQSFKLAGATVATLTFAYWGSTNNVKTVLLT